MRAAPSIAFRLLRFLLAVSLVCVMADHAWAAAAGTRDCSQEAGADFAAKLRACMAAAAGGVADAGALGGTQTATTDPFLGVSGSGTLLLPAATISAGAGWHIPSGWRLAGAGKSRTIIRQANHANMAGALLFSEGSHVTIEHLSIDMNRANNPDTSVQHFGIEMTRGSNVTVRDVDVSHLTGTASGSPSVGISFSGTTDGLIEDVSLSDLGTVGAGTSDAVFTSGVRNRITHVTVNAATDTGVVAETSTDPQISDVIVLDTPQCLGVDAASLTSTTAGATVTNVTCDSPGSTGGGGVFIFRTHGAANRTIALANIVVRNARNGFGIYVKQSSGISVVGFTLASSPAAKHGVLIEDSDRFSLTSGVVEGWGAQGVAIAGSSNGIVSGVLSMDNSQTSPGTYDGFAIGDSHAGQHSSNITLAGNAGRDSHLRVVDRTQARGLLVDAHTTGVFLSGNDFRYNRSNPGFFDNSAGGVRLGFNLTNDTANAPEQIDNLKLSGPLVLGSGRFSDLGTPANGALLYCSDCTQGPRCTAGGKGAVAKRMADTWVCD